MAIIQLSGDTQKKYIRHPDRCQECYLFLDDQVPWCTFYKRKIQVIYTRPDFCKVLSITILEES